MTAALSVSELSVRYGQALALDKVSLKIGSGEVVGLLGPNGAGKTTLVRALTGRLKPAAGSIAIAGNLLRPGQAHRHRLGFAPQTLGLYHQLSGRENLEVFARMAGLDRAQRRQRVAAVLDEVAMAERAHVRVACMSGGMQRRIHVAAALLIDPTLIILDEPTAGVDAEARELLHRVIAVRAAAGAGVLLITHELNEAERLCQRVAVLVAGRLHTCAPPAELVAGLFANTQVFVLELRDPPHSALGAALEALALRPRGSPLHWEGVVRQDPEEYMSAIRAAVMAAGGVVRALGVRAPDLALAVERLAESSA